MNKRAIVFLHGYMGSSKQFISLINALNFDSATERYNIVLPGHETSLDEFTGKKRKDWQNFVDDFVQVAVIRLGRVRGIMNSQRRPQLARKPRGNEPSQIPTALVVDESKGHSRQMGDVSRIIVDRRIQRARDID